MADARTSGVYATPSGSRPTKITVITSRFAIETTVSASAPPFVTNAQRPSGEIASPSGTVWFSYPSAPLSPFIAAFDTRIGIAAVSLRVAASKNLSSLDLPKMASAVAPSGVKRTRSG